MKLRIAVVLASGLLLSGCAGADLGDWFTFPDVFGGDDTAASPAQGSATAQTAAAEAPSTFCRGVAQQDASQNAFDPATQAGIARKSFAQCQAIYGSN